MARVDRAHFQYPSSGSGSGLHNGDTAEYCNTMREVEADLRHGVS